jgi:hypothetical protein
MNFHDLNLFLEKGVLGLDRVLDTLEDPLKKKSDEISSLVKFNDGEKKGPRTQKWGTGLSRQSQNMVPDCHKNDPTLVHKVETLKNRPEGSGLKFILSINQLKDILQDFPLKDLSKDTTRDDPKRLGSTGIMIYWDRGNDSYCIEK